MDPGRDYADIAVLFIRPAGAGIALTIVSLLASIGLTAAALATAGALLFAGETHQDVVDQSVPLTPRV